MNTILWIIQALLAVFFIMPGLGKITGSKEKHVADGHLKSNNSIVPIRILGVLEWLGCIGIIIPWLIGIAPILTPMAAAGFCLIMIAGMVVHTKKQEYKMLPMLIVVFILSAVVAYFRFAALV
ncbi:DoxX family protein [Chryseobacterium indologenes]|uniref:DoxX family protein n=1 Tax=Chryseobacterium indologenes TaxID=253 RepID=A0A0N0IXW2_CHRID|nr:DoxX family protein [Chryseobacterium indologenes]KPE52574.1 hypothetical protein AOB46_00695 [Chryseobacterium indologenes]